MSQQQFLFDEEQPPWEVDAAEERRLATIVFPTGPAREFDYLVPEALVAQVEVGRRVRVPFGAGDRLQVGWCVRVEHRPVRGRKMKEVREVVDPYVLLRPSMLRLTRWIAEYYLCDWGQVLDSVIPAGVRDQAGTRVTTLLQLAPGVAEQIATLEVTPVQRRVLQVLNLSLESLTPQQLASQASCSSAPINGLRRKGLITTRNERLRFGDHREAVAVREEDHALNSDQQQALDTIVAALDAGRHETVLLHGITGSGKTEVYIRAIQEVVKFGRQAIVLVPEIALTPQTRQRFRARFGEVAVLHSHLSDAERHWHWSRIARGEVSVVVGARSAIFAPVPHLGLVILDEEHESTFKQETAPRYHARDVALFRAREEQVPMVLGSATPSLESWHRAGLGEFRLVEMPRRVMNRPLPDVMTIDLRNSEREKVFRGAISRQLMLAMETALREGGQVILLLNRRGYSTHIQCPRCGETVKCPNCEIALTHHRTAEIALCHYCDHEIPPPSRCPKCQFEGMNYGGLGTQKLEAEVRARFSDQRCLRMDTDTMRQPGSHEKALQLFREGEVKILVGTQMIAKGLDFPNVTLVGVINADTALHLPDFRASERTFQLLVQVAGRTGRGDQGGRVMVQTFNPDHPAIQAAVRHDYAAFASYELPMRQMLGYPPYGSMVRLVVRGPVDVVAEAFAKSLADRIRVALVRHQVEARVLGPAPAPFAKLRNLYRFQVQFQSLNGVGLHAAMTDATQDPQLKTPDDVQWIVDVDPLDML
jgi:primosomal protein N' (replication factor Y)